MYIKKIFTVLLFLLITCLAHASIAARSGCGIDVSPLSFGNINPISRRAETTNSLVTISCHGRGRLSYEIELTPGNSHNYRYRYLSKMTGRKKSKQRIYYNIFTSPTSFRVWGNGRGGTYHAVDTKAIPFRVSYVLFGKILGHQKNISSGQYRDNVQVSLNF